MENRLQVNAHGAEEQEALGRRVGSYLFPGAIVYLYGEIGSGKTTLIRGMMRGLGIQIPVRSPTYTLVEPYEGHQYSVYHFDLYRLAEPEELHFFGAEEYFSPDSICILEWAERAQGLLPTPDLSIEIEYRDAGSRVIQIFSHTERGQAVLATIGGSDQG